MNVMAEDKNAEDKAKLVEREYQDFVYTVSHDLNAPLRHVKEFTKLLIGNREDNLTQEEQEYVHFINQSLQRIDDMQNALLTFSRLNTRHNPKTKININDIVQSIVEDVDTQGVEIVCDKMPVILADVDQIRLLFHHLIVNAIKFHKDHAFGKRVFIDVQKIRGGWSFEIIDNGIGMTEKQCQDAFRPFKRFDPERYDGIGMGLTIAQKIVRSHGGEISIEPRGNGGTMVRFSLKKN